MKPFFITVDAGLSLMVVPESEAHLDGHPILTYTYSIFNKNDAKYFEGIDTEDVLKVEKQKDQDYMGSIVFEQPDKLFNYIPGDRKRLNANEVQEVIEKITEYRDNPKMWLL